MYSKERNTPVRAVTRFTGESFWIRFSSMSMYKAGRPEDYQPRKLRGYFLRSSSGVSGRFATKEFVKTKNDANTTRIALRILKSLTFILPPPLKYLKQVSARFCKSQRL